MGTNYVVALNDRLELAAREEEFHEAPYKAPPKAPVLYIKPSTCLTPNRGVVTIEDDVHSLTAAPSLALRFDGTPNAPTGMALAIDLCETHDSVFRPAIRQQCRDGFLPLGTFSVCDLSIINEVFKFSFASEIVEFRWDQLLRPPIDLVKELSGFMTLSDGDVLLIGAPVKQILPAQATSLMLEAPGIPSLRVSLRRGDST